jgi:endonuclease/exonuclease/phosphatase family metal-dependent hydrolase
VNGNYGLASLVKEQIQVLQQGFEWIHEAPEYPGYGAAHPRLLQWMECGSDGKKFFVVNVHGLWNGQGKTDTPQRLAQSERIVNFLERLPAPFIVCGDFNLRPDTESLKRIESSVPGIKNWIAISGATSTRSQYYPKAEKFADYIFTSPGIEVSRFEVLNKEEDQVSDHLPLLLEFEMNRPSLKF